MGSETCSSEPGLHVFLLPCQKVSLLTDTFCGIAFLPGMVKKRKEQRLDLFGELSALRIRIVVWGVF